MAGIGPKRTGKGGAVDNTGGSGAKGAFALRKRNNVDAEPTAIAAGSGAAGARAIHDPHAAGASHGPAAGGAAGAVNERRDARLVEQYLHDNPDGAAGPNEQHQFASFVTEMAERWGEKQPTLKEIKGMFKEMIKQRESR